MAILKRRKPRFASNLVLLCIIIIAHNLSFSQKEIVSLKSSNDEYMFLVYEDLSFFILFDSLYNETIDGWYRDSTYNPEFEIIETKEISDKKRYYKTPSVFRLNSIERKDSTLIFSTKSPSADKGFTSTLGYNQPKFTPSPIHGFKKKMRLEREKRMVISGKEYDVYVVSGEDFSILFLWII